MYQSVGSTIVPQILTSLRLSQVTQKRINLPKTHLKRDISWFFNAYGKMEEFNVTTVFIGYENNLK